MGLVRKSADLVLDRFEDKIMEIYMRGGIAHRIMKKIKGEIDATPDSNELNDLFQRAAHYDDRKICCQLNYWPLRSVEEEIDATIHWLFLHEFIDQLPSHLNGHQSTSPAESVATVHEAMQ